MLTTTLTELTRFTMLICFRHVDGILSFQTENKTQIKGSFLLKNTLFVREVHCSGYWMSKSEVCLTAAWPTLLKTLRLIARN